METQYTSDQIVKMIEAYHNYVWGLAEVELSGSADERETARKKVDISLRSKYESEVPREIRDGLHKKLAENFSK